MKIGIIGPGEMSIPPSGWGAVEILIWQHKIELEKLGHKVTIFNDKNINRVIDTINQSDLDFVHCQYDNYIGTCNARLQKPYAVTSHYGWLTQPNIWDAGYHQIFKDTLQAPFIIALSEEIKNTYLKFGYQGTIQVLRNGAEFDKFNFNSGGYGNICIGKVEPRKQQYGLTQLIKDNSLINKIDFVGPVIDHRFERSGNNWEYLGEWDKDTLYQKLSDYSCLVLPSAGEAAPLVVPEALCAGLSVVVTRAAAANLDESLPWVYIVDDIYDFTDYIEEAQSDMGTLYCKDDIREHARNHFSWSVIIKEYEGIINSYLYELERKDV